MRRRGQSRADQALTAALEGPPVLHARRLQRAEKTGAWITVLTSTVSGTDLGAQEWRNALFLRYGLEPPDLFKYYAGCQAKFSISHALDCKEGGLVTARHNELCDGVADLACKGFTPSHVSDNHLIYSCRAVKRTHSSIVLWWGRLWPSRDGPQGDLCARVVPRPAGGSAGARDHPPARQTVVTGPTGPHPDIP